MHNKSLIQRKKLASYKYLLPSHVLKEQNAPPTIAVHNTPEALLVNRPSPLVAKEKIVGNMIELKKPIANNAHIAIFGLPLPTIIAMINRVAAVALNAK